MKPTIRISA